MLEFLSGLFKKLEFQSSGKWLVLSSMIGIVAGLGVIVFQLLGQTIIYFTLSGIAADDVRSWLYDDSIWTLAVARDVMVTKIVSVAPEDDLNTALQRFTALNLDELPVLGPNDKGKLLGMLRRKESIAAYNQSLMKHKQAME